jgi:hypothetical protein
VAAALKDEGCRAPFDKKKTMGADAQHLMRRNATKIKKTAKMSVHIKLSGWKLP